MKKATTLKLAVITATISVIGISSCKKKDNTPATTTNTTTLPPVTSNFYFQAVINGTAISYQDGVAGYADGGGDEGGSEPSGWQEAQNSELTVPLATKNTAGFYIMKAFTYQPTNTQIDSMFIVKSYSYGKESMSTSTDGTDGAKVYYIDANGVEWTTDLGSANQTGSTFNITENVVNTDGYSHHISKATFSCKLYNASGGTMTLTNGICKARTAYY